MVAAVDSAVGGDDMPAKQEHLTDQSIKEQNQQADKAKPGVLEPEPPQTSVTLRRSSSARNMPCRFKDRVMNIVQSLRPEV